MPGVFVNYRSDDEVFAAEVFDRRLVSVFGRERVFLDHRSLPAGQDFEPRLWEALRSSAVLLSLIGKRWLEVSDESGTRLLHRPQDYVRREIAEALRLHKIVIPVLLDGAAMPAAQDLPEDIRELHTRQYRQIDRRNVDRDVEAVVDAVREHVPAAGAERQPGATGQPSVHVDAERSAVSTGSGNAIYNERA